MFSLNKIGEIRMEEGNHFFKKVDVGPPSETQVEPSWGSFHTEWLPFCKNHLAAMIHKE
jgi:hypothetical protein